MKKSYISWWVIAAVLFWLSLGNFISGARTPTVIIFFALSIVFIYIGYCRWSEYQQYQSDNTEETQTEVASMAKTESTKKPIYKKWWFWVLAVIVVIALFPTNNSTPAATPSLTPQAETASPTEATSQPEETPNPLDQYSLSKNDKANIYRMIQNGFSSSSNPVHTSNASQEEIQLYEDTVIQEAADKYNISFDDAYNIYKYVSLGYLVDLDDIDMKLQYGDLLDVTRTGTKLVIKAKIKSQLNNDLTIKQNYFNVCDIIRSTADKMIDVIDYWAVADMQDGSEQKVIAFVVPADVVQKIRTQEFPDNTLGEYVEDLWILPSLRQ